MQFFYSIVAQQSNRRRSVTLNKPANLAGDNTKSVSNSNNPEQKFYRFYLGGGNNVHLIRKVLSTRKNWIEINDPSYMFINFKWQQTTKGYSYDSCVDNKVFKHSLNHLEFHNQLSNKQNLLKNLMDFCESNKMNVFDYVPVTFVLNISDPNLDTIQNQFLKFYETNLPQNLKDNKQRKQWLNLPKRRISSSTFNKRSNYYYSKPELKKTYTSNNSSYLWLLKPTFYNRGRGIHVFNDIKVLEQLMHFYIADSSNTSSTSSTFTAKLSKSTVFNSSVVATNQLNTVSIDPKKNAFRIREVSSVINRVNKIITKSFIIQKYLQAPLLIDSRKFDIRVWVLINQDSRVYLYRQGYIRTSSSIYSMSEDKMEDLSIHLTNNAVQKGLDNYGKFQQGNQLSFKNLENIIDKRGGDFEKIRDQMKKIVKMTALSTRNKLNKNNRKQCFEMFGYDFMIDTQFKVWLIEVNTNPCLEQSSLILENLIPRMVDDLFKITIDEIFEGSKEGNKTNYVLQNYENSQNLWDFIVDLKKPGLSF